jgi:TetR/AcrR family transcriptional regulator
MQRTLQRRLQHTGRERAETARDAILGAAMEIFARDGFSGARVDDIARQAGYNKALIFRYFDDKLGLYRALMLRTKQHLFARFEETFKRIFAGDGEGVTADLVRRLAAGYLDTLFEFGAEHPQAVRILAWEAAEGWQTFVSCAPSMPENWSERPLGLLKRAQAVGIVRPELDPRLLFTTLISLPLIHMTSLPRFAVIFPDADFTSPAAIAHARTQISDLLLCGILSPTTIDSDDSDAHTASHSGQTTLAHSAEEA